MESYGTEPKQDHSTDRAKRDSFFTLRDMPKEYVTISPVSSLKAQIGFIGSYPQMILPDNCHGNLPLLLNFLFCDDHRNNPLNPTPPLQSFCSEKLKKTLKDAGIQNMEAVVPGAFKEFIAYFVGHHRMLGVKQLEHLRERAKRTFEETGKLEEDNFLLLEIVRKTNLVTKRELGKYERAKLIPGSGNSIPKATIIVLNDVFVLKQADVRNDAKKPLQSLEGLAELLESKVDTEKRNVIEALDSANLSKFNHEDDQLYDKLDHALFHHADPDYVLKRYYDMLLALEADQLMEFSSDARSRGELGIDFVSRRIREIVYDIDLFESKEQAKNFFVKLICFKLKYLSDVSQYVIDEKLSKQNVNNIEHYLERQLNISKNMIMSTNINKPLVKKQIELQKYPHIMPSYLNLYFDNSVPRCVESAFAMYVIMLCYDFQNGGVLERARDSRFHSLIKKLKLQNRPISRWNFDELQQEMLEAIGPKSCLESELGEWKKKGKRPWFVMQNKGDMMTSVGFLYNYLVFFALPNSKYDYENLENDPFYINVLYENQTDQTITDPLGATSPITIKDTPDQPDKVIDQVQKLVSYINPSAKIEYRKEDKAKIGKFFLMVSGMISESDGALTMTRAQLHFGQRMRYDITQRRYSAYHYYDQQIKNIVFTDGIITETLNKDKIIRQFLELRMLNAHLGWNELENTVARYRCDEDPQQAPQYLQYSYILPQDYDAFKSQPQDVQFQKIKTLYVDQCKGNLRKIHPTSTEEQASKSCNQAYQYAMLQKCSGRKDVPFTHTFQKSWFELRIPGDLSQSISTIKDPKKIQLVFEQIARDNPVACRKLLENIKKATYGTLEYNSMFLMIDNKNFYDILTEMYGNK